MEQGKLLSDLNKSNVYLELIKAGYTKEQIKGMVIEEFDEFFVNKQVLIRNAIETLLPELINLMKLKNYGTNYEEFKLCLNMFRNSMNVDRKACFRAFATWSLDINKATNRYWVIYNLDRSRDKLNLEEYAEVSFKQIGDLIEGIIKMYSYNILNNIYIINGKQDKVDKFVDKDLGTFFNEIIESNMIGNLFRIKLDTKNGEKEIRLNQLRNIVAHKNYDIVALEIKCFIKQKNRIKDSFSVSRQQLQRCLTDVYYTFASIRLAYTIFFIDNVDEIVKYNPDMINVRTEELITNTFLGISSQGFNIIDFEYDSVEGVLVLKDISYGNESERMIHASQFLFRLWEITKSKNNVIKYVDNSGRLRAIFEIDSNTCQLIYNGDIEPLEQANLMKITII